MRKWSSGCVCMLTRCQRVSQQIPGQQYFVREWWSRVPDAGAAATHVLSGEPAPSAVPARKHHDGGEEPGASGKRAAVRIHRGSRRVRSPLAAPCRLNVGSARGCTPSVELALFTFGVEKEPKMERIYNNKTPGSSSIRWSHP